MAFTPPLQTKTGSIAAASLPIAYTNPVVAGDLLIAVVSEGIQGAAPPITCSDSLGNVYSTLFAVGGFQAGTDTTVFYCFSASSGPNTVTFAHAGALALVGIVAEYSLASGTKDQVASGDGGVYSITTTQSVELLVGACSNGLQPTTWTITGATNVAQVDATPVLGRPISLVLADLDLSTIGTYMVQFSASPAFSSSGGIGSFYSGSAASPTKLEISLFGVKGFGKSKEQECVELPPEKHVKVVM
jgi:hypothetical protein